MAQTQFAQLILNLKSPDNEIRKAAELEYEKTVASNGTGVICALAELCGSSRDQGVVMMGLVLLRKLFGKKSQCFNSADDQTQNLVKEQMLQIVGTAAFGPQRAAAASCISALAVKLDSMKKPWPELWSSIFQIINDPSTSSELRTISCEIMTTIGPAMTDHFVSNIGPITNGLRILLSDPSPRAKQAAFDCIIGIACTGLVPQLSQLVPAMLEVVQQSLNASDWSNAESLIATIAEGLCNFPTLFRNNANQLLQGMMQVAAAPEVAEDTRHIAVEAMLSYCESDPKTVRKIPVFLVSFFELLFNYMLSPTFEDDWDTSDPVNESGDVEEVTDSVIGSAGLDRLVSALGGRKLEEVAQRLFTENIRSSEWQRRNAALMLISYVTEGMVEVLSKDLGRIVEAVLRSLHDETKYVRASALDCLMQLSSDFAPDIQEQMHSSIVPAAVECFKDPIPAVAARAARCIDNFFDSCESDGYEAEVDIKDLERYVHDVCVTTVTLLKQTPYDFLRKDCLGVLSSVISTCKEQMRPFVNDLMPIFQEVFNMDDSSESLQMKCKTIECITLLAYGVGRDVFAPYAHHMCNYLRDLLASGLGNDDMRLRYVMRGWTCMVECLKEDVVPYMPIVMPVLLNMMSLDCDVLLEDAEIGEDSEEDEADEAKGIQAQRIIVPGSGVKKIKFHTGLIEDKDLATNVVMSIVTAIGPQLWEHLPQIALTSIDLLGFQAQPSLRESGALIIDSILELYENTPEYRIDLATRALPVLISNFDEETDPEISSAFSQAIGRCVDAAPMAITGTIVDSTSEKIISLLSRSTEQRAGILKSIKSENDEDEIDNLNGECKEIEEFITETCHLVDKLLERAATAFAPVFLSKIFPILENWIDAAETDFLVTRGFAILCSFVEYAPNHVAQHVPLTMQAVVSITSQRKDKDLLQCTFYLMNLLLQYCANNHSQVSCQAFVQEVLNIFNNYSAAPEARQPDYLDCTCNAISMITALLTSYYGIVPSQAAAATLTCVVEFLPVDGDEEEAARVHERVLRWVVENHPMLQSNPGAATAILERLRNANGDTLNKNTQDQLSAL